MSKHLWVNLADLMYPQMHIPGMGSILPLLINEELGDRLLPGAVRKDAGRKDDIFVIIKCKDETRPQALAATLEMIGKEKIGRKIRTRITVGQPTSAWQ